MYQSNRVEFDTCKLRKSIGCSISNEFLALTPFYTIKTWLKVVKMSDCFMTLYMVPTNAKDSLACPKEFGHLLSETPILAKLKIIAPSWHWLFKLDSYALIVSLHLRCAFKVNTSCCCLDYSNRYFWCSIVHCHVEIMYK